jgi:hypothetical protein
VLQHAGIGDGIFFLVIVGVMIFRGLRKLKEMQQQNPPPSGGADDDWGDWQEFSGVPGEVKPVEPVSVPLPSRPSLTQPSLYSAESAKDAARQELLRQLAEKQDAPPASVSQSFEHSSLPAAEPAQVSSQETSVDMPSSVFGQSLATAFPEAPKTVRPVRHGRFRIDGIADLRRAVVLREVLGQPRAFDI